MKINFVCPGFFGTSGYSNHAKNLANALNKIADVKISAQLVNEWEKSVNDAELKMINKEDDEERVNLILDLPFNWNQYANKKVNFAFLVWEGDKIPISWIEEITSEKIDKVLVPSSHVYNAIKNTFDKSSLTWQIIKEKIKIIPHGVNLEIFKPEEKESRPFTFLVNKGFRNELDRGGMQHAIKAFVEEFDKGEARLVLKLNPAYAMPPNLLIDFVQRVCKEASKTSIGEIVFNYEAMSYEHIKDIYNNSDVLLNPTEGEAFSLPAIESMACKKPVITTNFGGQTDFVTNSNGWLIDYELKEVKHEVMYEGIKWAKPNIDQLKKAMREAQSNPELLSQKANRAFETALNWTWDNSANKILELEKYINTN